MSTELRNVTRRRALLAGGGGLAALVSGAFTPPDQVLAANGDGLVLGVTTNAASSETRLTDSGGYDGAGLNVIADARSAAISVQCNNEFGSGLRAQSASGIGVVAVGNKAGVVAQGSSGPAVAAENFYGGLAVKATSAGPTPGTAIEASGDLGLKATGASVGVQSAGGEIGVVASVGQAPTAPLSPVAAYGQADGDDPTGIWGQGGTVSSGFSTGVYGEGDAGVWGFGGWGVFGASDATGTGVYGFSGGSVPAAPAHTGVFGYSDSGVGVYAKATSGLALLVSGKARFTRAGRARIAAGRRYVDVTVSGGLAGSPVCLANLLTYRAGFYVAAVRPNYPSTGKMRIYLNKVLGSATYVSYFVAN